MGITVNILCESLHCKSSTCALLMFCFICLPSQTFFQQCICRGHKIGARSGLIKWQTVEAFTHIQKNVKECKKKLFWNSLKLFRYPMTKTFRRPRTILITSKDTHTEKQTQEVLCLHLCLCSVLLLHCTMCVSSFTSLYQLYQI